MITVIPAGLILLLNLQSINCLLEIKYGERTELSEFSLFPSKSQRKKMKIIWESVFVKSSLFPSFDYYFCGLFCPPPPCFWPSHPFSAESSAHTTLSKRNIFKRTPKSTLIYFAFLVAFVHSWVRPFLVNKASVHLSL